MAIFNSVSRALNTCTLEVRVAWFGALPLVVNESVVQLLSLAAGIRFVLNTVSEQ